MVLGSSKNHLNDKVNTPDSSVKGRKQFHEKLPNLKVEDVINETRAGPRAHRKSTSLLKPSTPSAVKNNRKFMFGQDQNLSVHESVKKDFGRNSKNTRGKINNH